MLSPPPDSSSTCWGRGHPGAQGDRTHLAPSTSIQALWEQSGLPASLPRVPPAGHRCPSWSPSPHPLPPRSHSLDIIDPGEVEGRMLAA